MNRLLWLSLLLLTAPSAGLCVGQEAARNKDPNWLLPLEDVQPAPNIPTLKQVLGFGWAEEVSSPAEIERYLHALTEAAPDRSKLVRYGESYEGRSLHYLVISSPRNMKRLEEIRRNNLRLSDPRTTSSEEATALLDATPAIVWLAYNVHGNECSTTDAALLTAYHLLSDRQAATRKWLEQLVVIIDPLQNPDGRNRFVNSFRQNRGTYLQPNPLASEHREPWPGGRTNHYWFDMNRDWFLHSQRETAAKVAAYLDWRPQIYVDAHEMGRDATYFFAPPSEPINPFQLARQHEWLFRIGRHHASRFDQYGFRYTTREMFDAFYPGYGSEWPILQGGLGILWEQASTRGLVIDRSDETKLYYHDAVRHHYVSGVATIELAAKDREALQRDYFEGQQRAIHLVEDGPVRHYFLLEQNRPQRAASLAQLLVRNAIDVYRLESSATVHASDMRGGGAKPQRLPEGTYHIPVAQPNGRLARVLLDREIKMDEEFVTRQLRRNKMYMPDEIYDVTAWSLPLAFDITCLASEAPVEVEDQPYRDAPPASRFPDQRPQVAYLVPGTDGAQLALCQWLRSGVRVHVVDRALTLNGRDFAPGTLILFVHENSERLHENVQQVAQQFGLSVFGTDTGFVAEGAHLGGPYVKWVRPPKVVMPIGRPTSYSVGHTWHLFDQRLRYPTTRVDARDLGNIDLDEFNVLVLPNGSYSENDGFDEPLAQRIRQWVSQGGTLVLLRGAALWALKDDIELLPTSRLLRPVEDQEDDDTKQQPESKEPPKMIAPDSAPGVFLKASVFTEHWVTFAYGDDLDVFFTGNLVLKPLLPTDGRDLVTFAEQDELLTSGFCWPETLELLAETPYVTYRSIGRGHVIAFTDDPNYRAMYPGLQRLFINAVLYGPGH